MATITVETNRKFMFKNIELIDPDPELLVDEVKDHYLGMYPDLLNTKVQKTSSEGIAVYTFQAKTGGHG